MASMTIKNMARVAARACLSKNSRQELVNRYISLLNAYYAWTDFERTCRVRDSRIKLNISSFIEDYRAKTFSSKEPETLNWLEQNFQEGDVLFDIGANVGLYSLYAATVQEKGTIYSFEPEAKNFNRLCKNISSNRISNIIPCNFPLSDSQEFSYFFVHDSQPGSALHHFGAPSEVAHGFGKNISFKQGAFSMPLDDLIRFSKVKTPNLIKIDVDGLELKILDGAKKLLASNELRTVLVEANDIDNDGVKIESLMKSCGLSLAQKSDWQALQDNKISQNFIFNRC